MARTILIEAAPWDAATGAVVNVALAGGGARAYRHRARNDWRAGVVSEPRFQARIDFDQDGFAGGARPQMAPLEWAPAKLEDLATVSGLLWNGAPVEVFVGDDLIGAWSTLIKGTVELQTVRGGSMFLKIRDVTADLDKPVASDRFTGAGGAEGDAMVAERLKRRSFGRCSNVEAQLLKEATLIYEVGDPSKPLQSIDDIKDMGRSGSSLVVVAWQGSIAATLAALEAQAVAPGGGAAAPSIACVKWWTRPVGPLTVDLKGEVGAGYVETTAAIAQRVIDTRSALAITNIATAAGWRPGEAGIHFDSSTETIAQGLDRLIRGSSLAWNAEAAGTILLSRISFEAPVETVKAVDAARSVSYKPLKRRRVGYRRNHRVHDESELSAAPALGLVVQDTAPSPAASSPGQLWQDADGRYWKRRDDYYLAIGGNRIMIGGNLLTMAFEPQGLQPVRDGIDGGVLTVRLEVDAVRLIALDAQATADGKIDSFYQTSAPGGTGEGDIWFDTDDGNKQYIRQGGIWVVAQDQSIGLAITAAAGAQATADGKVTTFLGESAPTAEAVGDLWLKASTGELRRWSGAAWGDPIVDLTAASQVTVVAPPNFTLYRDWQGAMKAGQLPRYLLPQVTRGGLDYRTNNAVSYSVTGSGALAGKVSVDNTNGSSTKGQITIANTATAGGGITLNVSVNGIATPPLVITVGTQDDPPPAPAGGSGGTDSSVDAPNSTSTYTMTNNQGGDEVLDVALNGSQTLKLFANLTYQWFSSFGANSQGIKCKAQYYAGGVWTDFDGSGFIFGGDSYSDEPGGPINWGNEGYFSYEWSKAGLAAATYPVRLVGQLTNGSYSGTMTMLSGTVTSFRS